MKNLEKTWKIYGKSPETARLRPRGGVLQEDLPHRVPCHLAGPRVVCGILGFDIEYIYILFNLLNLSDGKWK